LPFSKFNSYIQLFSITLVQFYFMNFSTHDAWPEDLDGRRGGGGGGGPKSVVS